MGDYDKPQNVDDGAVPGVVVVNSIVIDVEQVTELVDHCYRWYV